MADRTQPHHASPSLARDAIALGPFLVDSGGALLPRDPATPPCFLFAWRHRRLRARLEETKLHLTADIGMVPSSARHVPRPPLFAALSHLPRALPQDWRVSLAANHTVRLDITQDLPAPLTAAALMTEITRRVLELAPFWEWWEEAAAG